MGLMWPISHIDHIHPICHINPIDHINPICHINQLRLETLFATFYSRKLSERHLAGQFAGLYDVR